MGHPTVLDALRLLDQGVLEGKIAPSMFRQPSGLISMR
jgi:hypothetical protein